MSNWIDINDKQPNHGQNVIAVGRWSGEIQGLGEDDYMGIGSYQGSCVSIDSDTYSTGIVDIKFWMPLPDYPEVSA